MAKKNKNLPEENAQVTAEEAVQTEETVVEAAEEVQTEAAENVQAVEAEPAAAAAADGYAKRGGGKRPNPDKKTRIPYERKKRLYGYAFILLWLLGTIYLFIIPMVESMRYSLSATTVVDSNTYARDPSAYPGLNGPGVYCEWNNFGNYIAAFTTDQNYIPNLLSSISSMPGDTFMILVFSLFIALLLSQKFKGRGFARAIFFIPVLVATGPVLAVINGDMGSQGVGDASQFSWTRSLNLWAFPTSASPLPTSSVR